MKSTHASDALLTLGAIAITTGTAMWSMPLALVVGGALLIGLGILIAYVSAPPKGVKSNAA